MRPISPPDQQQRIVYNGHKRVHALKFQSVALPNGSIGNMYGPVVYMYASIHVYLCSFHKIYPIIVPFK